MISSPNEPTAVSLMGTAIQDLADSIAGTRIQGASVTPDADYAGRPIREWLEDLAAMIDRYLRRYPPF